MLTYIYHFKIFKNWAHHPMWVLSKLFTKIILVDNFKYYISVVCILIIVGHYLPKMKSSNFFSAVCILLGHMALCVFYVVSKQVVNK